MTRMTNAGIVFAMLLLRAPSTANAQDRSADARAAQEANRRFSEGIAHVSAGEYEPALLSFRMAYTVHRSSKIMFNIALCEERLGRTLDALGHYKEIAAGPAASEKDGEDARQHAARLLPQVASIDVQAPAGTRIALDDGPERAVAPLNDPLNASPGAHVVHLRFGGSDKSVAIDAPMGVEVHVAFPPSDAPAAASPPPAENPLPPAADRSPPIAHETSSTARNVTVAIVGAAAVVGVAGGAYFAVRSRSEADAADRYRSQLRNDNGACAPPVPAMNVAPCADLQDASQTQTRDFRFSNALYLAGGALAAGALVTWLVWPRSRSAAAWLVPAASPGSVAVTAGGRF